MIFHFPGGIKKMLKIKDDFAFEQAHNDVLIITYKDHDFNSVSDRYQSVSVMNGKMHNSQKMYDIMKYIIQNHLQYKYVLIIDCNDVYVETNTIDEMISDNSADIFLSSYYALDRGFSVNSGAVFGSIESICCLAEAYIHIYDYASSLGIQHKFDERIFCAAIDVISPKYIVNKSNEHIKTINCFNSKDVLNYSWIFDCDINDIVAFYNAKFVATINEIRKQQL